MKISGKKTHFFSFGMSKPNALPHMEVLVNDRQSEGEPRRLSQVSFLGRRNINLHKQKIKRKSLDLKTWLEVEWGFWFRMHFIMTTGIICFVIAVHHWKKPNISLMGNNCGVGSDAFICTEEYNCVHPIITVTQQTLVNLSTAEHPSSSQSPEMQEYWEARGLSQGYIPAFHGVTSHAPSSGLQLS